MQKKSLAKAVSLALSGVAFSFGVITESAAAPVATTMYNMSTASGASSYDNDQNLTNPTTGGTWGYWNVGTDGWQGDNTFGAAVEWVGTGSTNTAAFGYTGEHLNWGVQFTGGLGNTATISTFDSFNRYGRYADIDTAKGAWSDAASGGAAGWRHDLEMGLFKTDVAGTVTLNAQGILQSNTNFGFTIFRGMGSQGAYNHHGGWNAGNNTSGLTSASLPGGGTNFDPDGAGPQTAIGQIVAYSVGGASPLNLNTISFEAEANQIYAIWLGGYKNGSWGDTVDGYQLSISQPATVPLPGTAWLLASGLFGLLSSKRKKS
jgi:hypothetical protein